MTNKIDKLEYLRSRVSDLEKSRKNIWVWIITLIVLIIIIGSSIGVLENEVNDLKQPQPYESCSFSPASWLDKTKVYKIEINKDHYTIKDQNGEILESWFCDKQHKEVCVNETYLEKVNYSCNETVGYNYCDRIYLEKTKEVCHYE